MWVTSVARGKAAPNVIVSPCQTRAWQLGAPRRSPLELELQREGCGLLQNRDKTGATNIGSQFRCLVRNQPPLRPMSAEELEFHRLATCVECAE